MDEDNTTGLAEPVPHEWSWVTIPLFFDFAKDRNLILPCASCAPEPLPLHPLMNLRFNAGDTSHIPWVSSYAPSEKGVNTFSSRHIPCVRVTCTNCGSIRHFSMYPIKDWHDAKLPTAIPENGS